LPTLFLALYGRVASLLSDLFGVTVEMYGFAGGAFRLWSGRKLRWVYHMPDQSTRRRGSAAAFMEGGPTPKCYIPAAMTAGRPLLVPASAEGLRLAAEAFDAFASARGIPLDVVRSVQVALDEVLSNTVHHGYRSQGKGRRIEIGFRIEDGILEVTIQDDAPAFNPLAAPVPDTTSSLAKRRERGLGILLTRRLMDEVEYARAEGRNRVTLRKRTVAGSGSRLPRETP
jgi:anti-sigma regulatory factor (Ser/Thr protein kinase)